MFLGEEENNNALGAAGMKGLQATV